MAKVTRRSAGRRSGKKRHQPVETLDHFNAFAGCKIWVSPDDCIYSAAKDLVCGENVLFIGEAGGGKTSRSEALNLADNFPKLLKGTPFGKIQVEIVSEEVDLIPILANLELLYEQQMKDSSTLKIPTMIAKFILAHGFEDETAFRQDMAARNRVLDSGKGKIRLCLLRVDDFDRVHGKEIPNAFMKFIDNYRHQLWNGAVRYLNLQCVATSNSSVGAGVLGRYLGSIGIDVAIYNRFFPYRVASANMEQILKQESPQAVHSFIDKLTGLVYDIHQQQWEGAFRPLGEISMRQLRPIVRQYALGLHDEITAAAKLFAALDRKDEEHEKAEMILNRYFGSSLFSMEDDYPF